MKPSLRVFIYGYSKTSPETIRKIRRLAQEGIPYKRIAFRLHVSVTTVRKYADPEYRGPEIEPQSLGTSTVTTSISRVEPELQPTELTTGVGKPKPRKADFKDDEEGYIEALTDWRFEKKTFEESRRAEEARIEAVSDAFLAIIDACNPELVYQLARNPELCEKMNKMSLANALLELGRFAASLENRKASASKTAAGTRERSFGGKVLLYVFICGALMLGLAAVIFAAGIVGTLGIVVCAVVALALVIFVKIKRTDRST